MVGCGGAGVRGARMVLLTHCVPCNPGTSGLMWPRSASTRSRTRTATRYQAFVSHLDLSRAPYVLYGVKYIDLVSLGAFVIRYFLFSCHISVYVR